MPRWCHCDQDDCRLCRLYREDPRYRRLWDAPQPPGWLQRAAHFGAAVVAHAADGFAKRAPEEIDRIYEEHCQVCPQFVAEVCAKCGCGLKKRRAVWLNKLAWRSEHCPEGKW